MRTHTRLPLVAVIDGDEPFLALMGEVFAMEGYATVTARHPTDAPALLRDTHPDLLLLDLVRGRTLNDGLALLRALRTHDHDPSLPVIVTATSTDLLRTYAAEFTAPYVATLAKPFDLADLLHLVSALAPAGAVDMKERTPHAQQTHPLLPATRLVFPLPPARFPSPYRRDPALPRAVPLSRFGARRAPSSGTARAVAGAGHGNGRDAPDAVPGRGNR